MLYKLLQFASDDVLDHNKFSGRYVYLVNNSHIVVINQLTTDSWLRDISYLDGLSTESYLSEFTSLDYAPFDTDVALLIDSTFTNPINYQKYTTFNQSLTLGFGEQSTNLSIDISDYLYELVDGVTEPHYEYSNVNLDSLLYYASDKVNATKSELLELNDELIINRYELLMYNNLNFLANVDYWLTHQNQSIELIRGQFEGFMSLIENEDVFKISQTTEYTLIPNQSTRERFILTKTDEIKNCILSAFDELLKSIEIDKNIAEIKAGVSLFYQYFLNLKIS